MRQRGLCGCWSTPGQLLGHARLYPSGNPWRSPSWAAGPGKNRCLFSILLLLLPSSSSTPRLSLLHALLSASFVCHPHLLTLPPLGLGWILVGWEEAQEKADPSCLREVSAARVGLWRWQECLDPWKRAVSTAGLEEGSGSQVFPCPVAAPWFPGGLSHQGLLLLHRNTCSDPFLGSHRGQRCPGIAFPLENVL